LNNSIENNQINEEQFEEMIKMFEKSLEKVSSEKKLKIRPNISKDWLRNLQDKMTQFSSLDSSK